MRETVIFYLQTLATDGSGGQQQTASIPLAKQAMVEESNSDTNFEGVILSEGVTYKIVIRKDTRITANTLATWRGIPLQIVSVEQKRYEQLYYVLRAKSRQ